MWPPATTYAVVTPSSSVSGTPFDGTIARQCAPPVSPQPRSHTVSEPEQSSSVLPLQPGTHASGGPASGAFGDASGGFGDASGTLLFASGGGATSSPTSSA